MASIEITDRKIATILAVSGPLLIAIAFARTAHPFNMLPGMDGAFTCGQLGFVLAMLHGIKFRRVLQLMLPIVAIELTVPQTGPPQPRSIRTSPSCGNVQRKVSSSRRKIAGSWSRAGSGPRGERGAFRPPHRSRPSGGGRWK